MRALHKGGSFPSCLHLHRVDASITNHLIDFVPNLEPYKVVQIFLV